MKLKKTVTEAVRAANRANAQFSTGPRTEHGKSNARHNALLHGILAKKIVLRKRSEKVAFAQLLETCNAEFRPEGLLESVLVEEITVILWKLGIALKLETLELSRRQDLAGDVDGVFRGPLRLPLSDLDLPLERGWDCERVIVRAVSVKDESDSSGLLEPTVVQNKAIRGHRSSRCVQTQKGGQLEVQAVLGSSLDKMTRYQSALKREFYRAVETLRSLQAERRETSG